MASAEGNHGVPNGTTEPAAKDSGPEKSNKEPKKLSGAELKKQKQAEKQAKRAQKKSDQQGPAVTVPDKVSEKSGKESAQQPKQKPSTQAKKEQKTPESLASGSQHQRKGSVQRAIPIRAEKTTEKSIAPVPKEVKRVALFGHLYSQEHRTTLAGAHKDVHPAVLALGLQMSSYVVCGSSARCVATLLAFKQVCC